jgi:hypothetical protein
MTCHSWGWLGDTNVTSKCKNWNTPFTTKCYDNMMDWGAKSMPLRVCVTCKDNKNLLKFVDFYVTNKWQNPWKFCPITIFQ